MLRWLQNGARFLGAAAVFAAVFCLFAWLCRPDLTARPVVPPPADVAAVRAARTALLDTAHPPRLQVEVDYTQGASAPWWPKGEAPLLAEIVQAGDLPPVAERIGSEPCVYRGSEGLGRYGGTWVQSVSGNAGAAIGYRSASTLVRWSPQGYPLVPHVAKAWETSPDFRTYTFHLRKGMRWSDGAPFTADDIMYWWEHEATDKIINPAPPPFMTIQGTTGRVVKVDALTVRFEFAHPHGLFLPLVATQAGTAIVGSPAHYLKPFHPDPRIGDAARVAKLQAIRRLGSPRDVYLHITDLGNPEHPRLWPWLYRTYRANAPYSFVRNPYYWMVDEVGNQLPYVDRIYAIETGQLSTTATISGQFTMTVNKPLDYTLLMSNRAKGHYRVYRWVRADASDAMIHCNLNRRVDPGRPDTKWKHALLNEKRFRQALSLAIDRRNIIDANYYGETQPAQCAPHPGWPFYHERAFTAFTEHDVARANRLLDEIGLTQRDSNGFRTAPDGTRLTFFLNHWTSLNPTTAQFIVDDWAVVGIRAIPRVRESRLFYTEKNAFQHDFTMFTGENELVPILDPRTCLPCNSEANFAIGFARWYQRGGLYGNPLAANDPGSIPVPTNHPLYRGLALYEQIKSTGDEVRQRELFAQILDIQAENVWTIGLCTSPRYVVTVADGFRNVPVLAANTFTFLTPGHTGQETYFFERSSTTPAEMAAMRQEVTTITPEPDSLAGAAQARSQRTPLSLTLKTLCWGIGGALLLMLAVRHPFVGRRLLIMVPTLLFISVVVFTIIQLPPGDFLTSKIMELQISGDQVDQQQLDNLRSMYHLDDGMVVRYLRWVGVHWFKSFDPQDQGLLQGNLGRSMANNKEVSQIIGDRILLTFLLSLGSILFTWAVALPIGIYSAVRQYSLADYLFTLFGFIGMCIPSFLLAVVIMYFMYEWTGVQMVGLFSPRYAMQAHWDWAKTADMLKHMWMPVLILGIGSTGGMIRVMRGNLLDELKKPYVTTARAKGVRPLKLLLKYPVRLALNPFISGIGGLFPALISGGTLISIILSLPTVGPLMLNALMSEDTLLAGSLLMVLSLLGVFGVLVSDLLLLWVDPRIRFEEGSR